MGAQHVGDRLRRAMQALDLTEVEAAAIFRVSQQTVRNWLSGRRRAQPVYVRILDRLEERAERRAAARRRN